MEAKDYVTIASQWERCHREAFEDGSFHSVDHEGKNSMKERESGRLCTA